MIKQIIGTKRYFISDEGYCFKVNRYMNKEHRIELQLIKGVPKVKIENKKINLVNLMVEHFIGDIGLDDRITHRVIDGKVPLSKIKIITTRKCSSEDDLLIFKYKCSERASNANYRVNHSSKIDKIDVLNSLLRTAFKCHYCGENIKPKTWNLDHVHPLSKGGLNKASNIIPSCRTCNLMKSNLGIDKFIFQCGKISDNFKG